MTKRPKKPELASGKGKVQASTKKPSKKLLDSPKYLMPREVSDWIERAQSIMNHQKGEIFRLKEENTKLKSWRKWAEGRILRSDHE